MYERVVWDFHILTDQATGSNYTEAPNVSIVKKGSIHTDKNIISYSTAIDNSAVANMHIISNINTAMNNRVILDVGILTNSYGAVVSSDYCPWPYTRVLANFYITNNIGSFADKG